MDFQRLGRTLSRLIATGGVRSRTERIATRLPRAAWRDGKTAQAKPRFATIIVGPMIREACIRDRKLAFDSPGYRVLVMRLWPRGVRRGAANAWIKDAAPSRELLEAYHRGLPWPEFEQRYRAEMLEERPHVLAELLALEREHGLIILLCHEQIPPEEHCHRQVLLDLLTA
jgi:uncharacterized protein YeaO (DUF488 family)